MNNDINYIITNNNLLISNLIHSIDKKILSLFNKELSRYGLSFQQAAAILYIAKHSDKNVYQKDIEIYMGLTNPSVTSLMKNLINNDYVYRIKDEKDGRYYHLHLTDKSLHIKNELVNTIHNTNKYIETLLGIDQYNDLTNILQNINQKLTNIDQLTNK